MKNHEEKVYHHCTSSENIEKIKKDGWICADYFGETGVYLEDNPFGCEHFGEKIIVIDSCYIDESDLEVDDVNDGIFHKGAIPFFDFDVYDTDEYIKLWKLSEAKEFQTV